MRFATDYLRRKIVDLLKSIEVVDQNLFIFNNYTQKKNCNEMLPLKFCHLLFHKEQSYDNFIL